MNQSASSFEGVFEDLEVIEAVMLGSLVLEQRQARENLIAVHFDRGRCGEKRFVGTWLKAVAGLWTVHGNFLWFELEGHGERREEKQKLTASGFADKSIDAILGSTPVPYLIHQIARVLVFRRSSSEVPSSRHAKHQCASGNPTNTRRVFPACQEPQR